MRISIGALAAVALVSSLHADEKPLLLIHRIGPAVSTIHVARADGSDERPLLKVPALDYNASLSADGQWIAFTSERGGSADLYRVRLDGSSLERLTADDAYDDQATWSPDASAIAFVSSRTSGTTDIWTLDVGTKTARNITSSAGGDFRPSWSPDGKWIAFSSDRGTTIERDGQEWEHLQRTSIYVIRPNGQDLRRLTNGDRFAGSPQWSPDSKRIVFYDMYVADTHKARGGRQSQVQSQIVSIDVDTGARVEHSSGPGLKISPQFLSADRIGYVAKGVAEPGIRYSTGERGAKGELRNPSWAPDGARMVYDRGRGENRRQYEPLQRLFSHVAPFELAHLAAMGAYSHDGNRLALSERVVVNGVNSNDRQGVTVMSADGGGAQRIFFENETASMAPRWTPDDQSIVVGVGPGFQTRNAPARIVMMGADGSNLRTLTSAPGAGFPSISPDGTRLVFRVWGAGSEERGLRVLTIATREITRLTSSAYDTFPGWSPAGDLIAFSSWRNGDYDIHTIRPDGTREKQLTNARGNDAHSSWSPDGKHLMFSSSRLGFKDEAPLFDGQPQPYGEIFVMRSDGSEQRQLTDNQWEDGPGTWRPASTQARRSLRH
jgi:Tol biopolymer transport system component